MGPMRRRVSDVIIGIPSVRQIYSSIVPRTSVTTPIADLVSMSPMGRVFYGFLFLYMYFRFRYWPFSRGLIISV